MDRNDPEHQKGIIQPEKHEKLVKKSSLVGRAINLINRSRNQAIPSKAGDVRADVLLTRILAFLREKYPDWGWILDSRTNEVVGKANKNTVTFTRDVFPWDDDEEGVRHAIEKVERQMAYLQKDFQQWSKGVGEFDAVQLQIMPYLKLNIDERVGLDRLSDEQTYRAKLVKRSFIQELNISVYLVVDSEEQILYVNQGLLDEWGIDSKHAFQVALGNLKKSTSNAVVRMMFLSTLAEKVNEPIHLVAEGYTLFRDAIGTKYAIACQSGDGYDATRILLPSFRAELCKVLDVSHCYIGIPNRDFMIAFVPELWENFMPQIMRDFQTHGHRVCNRLFVANANGELGLASH